MKQGLTLFHRLNYRINAAINPIADKAIFTFLPRAILFNALKVLFHIVERTVKKLRRGLHNAIDGRVAINQDEVRWFHVLGIKLADKVFSLSPQRKRAVGIMQGDIVQVFKVGHVDKFPVR